MHSIGELQDTAAKLGFVVHNMTSYSHIRLVNRKFEGKFINIGHIRIKTIDQYYSLAFIGDYKPMLFYMTIKPMKDFYQYYVTLTDAITILETVANLGGISTLSL